MKIKENLHIHLHTSPSKLMDEREGSSCLFDLSKDVYRWAQRYKHCALSVRITYAHTVVQSSCSRGKGNIMQYAELWCFTYSGKAFPNKSDNSYTA
jgi:hypothetical protein